jgi:tetratricopeptide (TPR) repeat protein
MICTPRYKRSADNLKGAVGYETNIIATQIWLTADHRRYITVLKNGSLPASIPYSLQGKCYIDLSDQHSFEQQYALLLKAIKEEHELVEKVFASNDIQGSNFTPDYENLSFAVLEKLDKTAIGGYISYYRELVIKKPQDDKAYFGLGLCALHYGMAAMAIDKLGKALRMNPLMAEYHYYYALSLCSKQPLQDYSVEEIKEATESIVAAIQSDGQQAKYYCFLLLIYNSFPELVGEAFPQMDLNTLQQQSRQHYRDEHEIRRLASLVAIKNRNQINLLF